MKIAVVVPTNRPESIHRFEAAWLDLICAHDAACYVVYDGDTPDVRQSEKSFAVPDEVRSLVNRHSDEVRNLGFYVALREGADIIITLDDDVTPNGNDPIQEHLDALSKEYPTTWFNPFGDTVFMRGFPYEARSEAPAWVSHGIWKGDLDLDAPTRLLNPKPEAQSYIGPIPHGCLTPISGMNLAFKREIASYVYFAPMSPAFGYKRFSDIWMGIHLKRELDARQAALVHGYSTVWHTRQSDVFKSLIAEGPGLEANETYWDTRNTSDYEKGYADMRQKWKDIIDDILVPF